MEQIPPIQNVPIRTKTGNLLRQAQWVEERRDEILKMIDVAALEEAWL